MELHIYPNNGRIEDENEELFQFFSQFLHAYCSAIIKMNKLKKSAGERESKKRFT